MTSPVRAQTGNPRRSGGPVAPGCGLDARIGDSEGGSFAVCLSGGSTPQRLYEHLAGPPYRDAFPWSRTHWFWGDEQFVPHDDALSNYRMVREALLSRAPIPAVNIHPIPTEGLSPEAAASAYERELKSFYGADHLDPARPLFDVNLLGLGPDGHTASLFPGSAVLAEREKLGCRRRRRQAGSAHHADLSGAREQSARGLPGRGRRKAAIFRTASPRRRQPAGGAPSSDRHVVALWRCCGWGGVCTENLNSLVVLPWMSAAI